MDPPPFILDTIIYFLSFVVIYILVMPVSTINLEKIMTIIWGSCFFAWAMPVRVRPNNNNNNHDNDDPRVGEGNNDNHNHGNNNNNNDEYPLTELGNNNPILWAPRKPHLEERHQQYLRDRRRRQDRDNDNLNQCLLL